MRSFQVITFLLLYDVLTLMFNSHYILVKVISKQAAACVSHARQLQVVSKQPAVIVSHHHFCAHNFTLFSSAIIFISSLFVYKVLPQLKIKRWVSTILGKILLNKKKRHFVTSLHFLSTFRKLIFHLTFQNTLIAVSFEGLHSFCH